MYNHVYKIILCEKVEGWNIATAITGKWIMYIYWQGTNEIKWKG